MKLLKKIIIFNEEKYFNPTLRVLIFICYVICWKKNAEGAKDADKRKGTQCSLSSLSTLTSVINI